MSNCVARCVAAARDGCLKSFLCFLPTVHARVGNRKAKGCSTTDIFCPFVQRDRVIESPHFAIQGSEQGFAVNNRWVELPPPFAGCYRFIVQAKVTVDLAREIAYPQRRGIDFGGAAQ